MGDLDGGGEGGEERGGEGGEGGGPTFFKDLPF